MRFIRMGDRVVNLEQVRYAELVAGEETGRHAIWVVFANGANLRERVADAAEGERIMAEIAAA